ncbi:MAG: CidA/LrgA family protein [Pseudomonadales bacterium]|nr:CidA/LrgA family protein [Pseudomonadales bacterium]
MLKGLLILIGFQLTGEFISAQFQLPFPGSVIGMGLLFLYLLLKGNTPQPLSTTSTALFPYIPLFLMPACVGAMGYWSLLQEEWLALLIALSVSTITTIALTPFIIRFFMSLASNSGKQSSGDNSNG